MSVPLVPRSARAERVNSSCAPYDAVGSASTPTAAQAATATAALIRIFTSSPPGHAAVWSSVNHFAPMRTSAVAIRLRSSAAAPAQAVRRALAAPRQPAPFCCPSFGQLGVRDRDRRGGRISRWRVGYWVAKDARERAASHYSGPAASVLSASRLM